MNGKVTYRQQVSYCGKPGCRKCREGTGHGPYWYAYRTVDGHTVRTYIGKHLPPNMQATEASATTGVPSLQLADLSIERDALPSAIDTLDRLLAADPANEAVVQRLMIALARLKRRGEALRAYQQLVSVLQKSYNALPSAETQALYEAIQRGEEAVFGTARFPATSAFTAISTSPQQETSHQADSSADRRKQLGSNSYEEQIGRTNQSPLVGRDNELGILCQLLLTTEEMIPGRAIDQKKPPVLGAIERQHPQCMVLMGEAGIGKTRLAEEVARHAQRRGWTVIWSRAYAQESGIPYRPWIEALRRIIASGLWPGQDVAQLSEMYQSLRFLLPELDELLSENWERDTLQPYKSATPEQEQLRLREAVYELLKAIGDSRPLLIVLDDVQWADASSCELLGYLARRLHGHPLVLLGTCRETELPSTHPLRSLLGHMQREHAVEIVHVQPLTTTQIGTLVADLPEMIVQHIKTQAAGNPFFAEELAHSFNRGSIDVAVAREDTQAVIDERLSALPATITGALEQRLSRLSSACQQLLYKAAVLGGAFSFHLLSAMEANSIDEDTLLDLLEEALRANVLTEEGSGTRVIYHFWHPLFASHLYNGLSATRRTRLHRQAADVLRRTYSTREEEHAATITVHLVKGGAEATLVARYAELAGNHAYSLSAYAEAERYYRLAIEHVEAGYSAEEIITHRDRRLHMAFLLERLAECTRIQGNFPEARQLFERVLKVHSYQHDFASLVEVQQEAQIQALLWSEIGWTWRYTGDKERALQCIERGEQVLHEAGIKNGPAWARLRFQQSSILWQEGNYEEARDKAREALKLFEESLLQQHTVEDLSHLTRTSHTLLGDPVDLGRTYALFGALANAIGQRTEALNHLNTALALYERHDRQREIAHVCCNIGHVHLKKAEYALAQPFLHRSLNLAERIGDTPLMSVVFHNLGEVAASSGDLAEAEAFYRRSLALAEQVNDREYVSLWNADLASVLQEQNKLAEAGVCIRRALMIGRAMRNFPCIGLALVALGNLRMSQAKAASLVLTVSNEEGSKAEVPDASLLTRVSPTRFLIRAKASLSRALALQKLEAETRTRAQLALARVSLLLGQLEIARQQALLAMEEAQHNELMGLLPHCRRLLAEIGEV